MSAKKPLISVIMCIHNGERYAKSAIDSILNQTYDNFEFIIIDDGSNDNSYEILNSYNDNRLRVVKQDFRGVAISLNKAISLAKGALIARQDSDDISMPYRFEVEVKFLEDNPNIDLVGTFSHLIDENNQIIKTLEFPTENEDLQEYIKTKNPYVAGSVMLRPVCFKTSGMFREQFLLGQHVDLWCRIAENHKIANISEYLYKYRFWDKAVSNEKAALFKLFSDLSFEFAKDRRETGKDILMTGDNYEFYMKYGEDITNAFGKYEVYRWLVNNP